MALVNKPDESIFASSAKQGEVDNFPDLLRGWGITFEQTQGIPPMEWFNFLFKRLDEKHAYLMQRGLPEWSATQDYTKGSCVQFNGLSYRAVKASKNNQPNEANSQYWVRWGFALSEISRATLTQYGLTQLYTGYDSQREDLALTPKTAYQLKQLINSNTRSLGNFIPNSKKSSRVDSNSAEDVATSVAVKTAYDKGVEAKDAADNANQNAEGRVSKSGDTMTGNLSLKQGDYSGLNLYNNDGYYIRLEGNPNNSSSMLTLVYRTPQGANIAVASLPKKNGVIAYSDDVVSKNGDSMYGTLSIAKSTENYKIGSYTWGMPIKFVGDAVIGNEKTVIAFNNNGSLHFGGLPGASQFNATLDGDKLWVAGDVKTALGRSLNNAIYKEGESHDIAFSWVSDGLKVRLDKTDLGRVAFRHDIAKEQLVWQGEMRNTLTVTLPVDRGILFVCVTKSWGAGTVFDMWLSAPIEHCNNTRLGDQDAGGSGGDYDFTMALLLNKSGRSLKLTPEGARKPIIKKIVVVGA